MHLLSNRCFRVIRFIIALLFACPAMQPAWADTPRREGTEEGAATTEAEAVDALNFDAPGMDAVKAAAKSGSMEALKKAYLDYRRTGLPGQVENCPLGQTGNSEGPNRRGWR